MKKAESTPRAATSKASAKTERPKAARAPKPAASGDRAVSAKAPKAAAAARTGKTITVTLLRSTIGFDRKQGAVVRGLGLRRIRHTVEVPDTPETRGMIHKVRHLVETDLETA